MTGREVSPIACSLSGAREIQARRRWLDSVFEKAVRIHDLEDGYAFEFPGNLGWTENIAKVVEAEKECCPFLTFTLVFEPDGGPITLRVTGPEGTKELIDGELVSGRIRNG